MVVPRPSGSAASQKGGTWTPSSMDGLQPLRLHKWREVGSRALKNNLLPGGPPRRRGPSLLRQLRVHHGEAGPPWRRGARTPARATSAGQRGSAGLGRGWGGAEPRGAGQWERGGRAPGHLEVLMPRAGQWARAPGRAARGAWPAGRLRAARRGRRPDPGRGSAARPARPGPGRVLRVHPRRCSLGGRPAGNGG